MRLAVSRSVQVLIDLFVLGVSFWLAFEIRFDWQLPAQVVDRVLFLLPYVIGVKYLLFWLLGVPRIAWRYIGLRDVQRILLACSIASATFLVTRAVALHAKEVWPLASHLLMPLGVNAIDFLISFLVVTGVRVSRRLSSEHSAVAATRVGRVVERVPTFLVGAGKAGVIVATELRGRQDLGIQPIAFIDDDPVKVGSLVQGIPVVGTTAELPRLVKKYSVKQALITVSNAPGDMIRQIVERCRSAGLETKIVPGLYEIVGGKINLSRIRNVAIEDVLHRDPITLDDAAIAGFVKGRSVLVTGAGGSIGSELCRQLMRYEPSRLILVERGENSLFEIHRELARPEVGFAVLPCIADVCDATRMEDVFSQHRPEVVFHAAAHKHVPMMERDPGEAIKNNVFGTKAVADLAHRTGASVFVMISTDKAVNPTSVMGATKRTAEVYIQALSARSQTRFVTVRFGNVLGSNGSVIPIFKQQIAAGGPVTVTHPEMKRYFMTIPEACQLVLQAGSMGKGGEIFILDMGEPVKIVDLARDLVRLSGFGEDEIPVVFTGTRPGEKLFEELSLSDENAERTKHPKVFVGRTRTWAWDDVQASLQALSALGNASGHEIRVAIRQVVPEYQPDFGEQSPPRGAPPSVSEPAGVESSEPANDALAPDFAISARRLA